MEALASTFPTPLAITQFYPSSGAILNGSSKEEAVRLQRSICEERQPAECTPSVKMIVVKSALFFCAVSVAASIWLLSFGTFLVAIDREYGLI